MLPTVLSLLALTLLRMVDAAITIAREAIGAWPLATFEVAKPVPAFPDEVGLAFPARQAGQDAPAVEGGVVAIEVLGPAAGVAVAGATGPDGQGPAQGGSRRQAGG